MGGIPLQAIRLTGSERAKCSSCCLLIFYYFRYKLAFVSMPKSLAADSTSFF
eukprot:COSAG03_NODE_5615_length_1209_cov_1.425225_1_plen_51_part_10